MDIPASGRLWRWLGDRTSDLESTLESLSSHTSSHMLRRLFGGDRVTETTLFSLIDVYRESVSATAHIPGNIPSILREAIFTCLEDELDRDQGRVGSISHVKLLEMLDGLPRLPRNIQSYLDHTTAILTNGPELSMNVPLQDGEALPERFHTLLQGTIWAVLMQASADPDLLDTEDKSGTQYDVEDKGLWFMCKKTFFSHQVAQTDGLVSPGAAGTSYMRMYAGKLFSRYPDSDLAEYRRMRCPPIIDLATNDGETCVAITPKGLYGVGWNENRNLGFVGGDSDGYVHTPARLTFTHCPEVQRFEQGLPPWGKDRLAVNVCVSFLSTLIQTPVGVVMAGLDAKRFVGSVTEPLAFNPLPLPARFVPDHIMADNAVVILTSGRTQLIGGQNGRGQLGVGSTDPFIHFTRLPFHVDRVISGGVDPETNGMFDDDAGESNSNVFIGRGHLLFAGEVPPCIGAAGLLPGFSTRDLCDTARPLAIRTPVSGIVYDSWPGTESLFIWITEGRTYCSISVGDECAVAVAPFEASEIQLVDERFGLIVRDMDGVWFHMNSTVVNNVSRFEAAFMMPQTPERVEYNVDRWSRGTYSLSGL
ncbi:hypothetical protein J8273_3679 [Carpediemonas membranifera]|uniref:Uncharacterized protein n=1 Tax=Carpediemonas membranifera TaxID=201153 RepID=A0A8J6E2T1_9EUKA|nr:hypothetical protein J8273_3679 [Carpediemonas membranifera]|eukprot:KAG9394706.1 hypothetical protein J8273_3679 [Carpediemonas membranifera]